MTRIVYFIAGTGDPTGGHKMVLRHVETLVELGLPAVLYLQPGEPPPVIDHAAPFDDSGIQPNDILVIPEDTVGLLRGFAGSPNRKFVFCQNHFYAAAAQGRVGPGWPYLDYLACSHTAAGWIARFLPHRSITVLPAFADERRFAPGPKRPVIVCTPRKRPVEAAAIRFMVSRLRAGRPAWSWTVVENAPEPEVARAFAEAGIFLSLNRLEGLGMTTLEAMASGCIPVGFTGIGGREYATPANGFWTGEDELEACADAVLAAIALIERGGPGAALMRAEAQATAARWSYAAFREVLAGFWSAQLQGPNP